MQNLSILNANGHRSIITLIEFTSFSLLGDIHRKIWIDKVIKNIVLQGVHPFDCSLFNFIFWSGINNYSLFQSMILYLGFYFKFYFKLMWSFHENITKIQHYFTVDPRRVRGSSKCLTLTAINEYKLVSKSYFMTFGNNSFTQLF